jgi:hypothetical protein
MGFRSIMSRPFAAWVARQTRSWSSQPEKAQEQVRKALVKRAIRTRFGRDHHFQDIRTAEDFQRHIPIRDYEGLKQPYIEAMLEGKHDVLWPGLPAYFSKTSGTTSGTKYIPVTRDSMPNHINGARNALLSYIHETGNAKFVDGKLIFLSGSPTLDKKSGIPTGRLSGIVNHHIPAYLRSNQKPSYATNVIEDWEEKLERIIDETLDAQMTLISGIPPWVQMYFDRIHARTGKSIGEVFPDFSLLVHAGVNFEPYRVKMEESIGRKVDRIELYPASEGFIAYQDSQHEPGLLMLLNAGIYFEFIPADEYFSEKRRRLSIGEVELGKNYAVIINNNAGLWGYSIGDTVKFVSRNPYRLVVTGRVKHFISAFGEHVIGEEVETAMKKAMERFPGTEVVEFTVAPQVTPANGLPHHEWLVEFGRPPHDLQKFAADLDEELRGLNTYYDDLISGSILRPLVLQALRRNSFIDYMKTQGKLGGQNKVPRLANDRTLADGLLKENQIVSNAS